MELFLDCSMYCFFDLLQSLFSAGLSVVVYLKRNRFSFSCYKAIKWKDWKMSRKKPLNFSSLNGCLLMCLEPFWLLWNLLHWLERNHVARRRGYSHQIMRNTLLFRCLGPNQCSARAGLGSQVVINKAVDLVLVKKMASCLLKQNYYWKSKRVGLVPIFLQ